MWEEEQKHAAHVRSYNPYHMCVCTVRIDDVSSRTVRTGDVSSRTCDIIVQQVCKLEGFFKNLLKVVILLGGLFFPQNFQN
jgi:hypothetical protein